MTGTIHNYGMRHMRMHVTSMRWLGAAVLTSASAALLASASFAGTPSRFIGVGARPLGMGGAFVGLADDAYALTWNPAGLPRLQRQEFTGGYVPTQLTSELSVGYGGATIPLGERQAIGGNVFYQTYSDDELDFSDVQVCGSYGVTIARALSLGLNAKYVRPVSTKLQGTQEADPYGFGFDIGALVDVGALVSPLEGLRLGVVARDVGGTSVKYSDTDISDRIYPPTYVVGASYKPVESLTIAADLDDRIHVGAEYTLLNALSLRGGIQRDVRGFGSDLLLNAGVGLQWRGLRFDYAYERHPVLAATHYVTLSFAYNPAYITIKDARVRPSPLYRAMYRTYETNPQFAEVTLKNTSQDPLRVSVGIRVPTMMGEGQAYAQDYTLRPQSTQTVNLGVAVDDSLLLRESASYDNFVQPEVFVDYEQERQTRRAARKLPGLYVLGRNKITWENPLRICSFVTPEHRSVIEFGDRVAREFRTQRDEVFDRCRNLGTAMIIFDAIGKYGVAYNPDQTTPYYKIASDTSNMRTIFDTVKYPVESFRSHLGDCDDLVVLYISLLEQQNIPTALLDVFDPVWGHVYMMFDTGLTPEEAMQTGLFVSDADFAVWTDPAGEDPRPHAWIPVETTMYGHAFVDAWKSGIDEYREKSARNYLKVWSITQGRQEFQSGTVDSFSVPFPEVAGIRELIDADIQQFRQRLELPPLEPPFTAEKYYNRGVELIERAQYDQAINAFTEALALQDNLADAYNGRGVARNHRGGQLRFMPDDPARRREQAEALWQAAVDDFKTAIRINPREPGYWVNLMISYRLLDNSQEAQEARRQALQLDEGLAPILDELSGQAQ